MEFWLEAEIDGFRMDLFSYYSKTPGLPDVPANDSDFHYAGQFYVSGPNEHQYLQEMNRKVLSKYDTFTVGEYGAPTTDMRLLQKYVGASRNEVNTLFNFDVIGFGRNGYEPMPFNLSTWRDVLAFNDAIGSSATGDG